MNTTHLKAYAPRARRQFIEAVKKRAAHLGIYADKISEAKIEGGAVIIEGRAFTAKQGAQRKRLAQRIAAKGLDTYAQCYQLFIREMAYTWFNRLAAIRYMELQDYLEHGFRVLSHSTQPNSLPEILGHAAEVADTLGLDKSHIIELQLDGDKEETLYRELLLGQCHHLANIMPLVFKGLGTEAIDDATELLLPDNLTKTDSILKDLVNSIPEQDWRNSETGKGNIEIIGWLYQFYIAEHKDAVMGKIVKSEDIPAATQLFTPNWIVKYLVQNSVGRQWLATYPDSPLKDKMEYYIEPAEQSAEVIAQLKAITPSIIDPEQIKVLDPAAGSGHILVEVYEVLREIYLERGYRLREIPELILSKNIYSLDIDDRAGQLAGFALMMRAREDDRRIFQRVQDGDVVLNVYSLQSSEGLDIDKLWAALDLEDKHQQGTTGGLFDEFDHRGSFEYQADDKVAEASIPAQAGIYSQYYPLLETLQSAFLQAKTLGSLIQIDNQHLANLLALKELLQAKEQGSDPAAKQAATELMPIVNQAIVLAQQYDAVIANPPYMGSKGMNAELRDFARKEFPNSKSDLFAIFMERAFGLLHDNGYNAQINMQSWMFLSSYEALRKWLLETKTFVTMAHLGARAFGQISGEVVQTTAWVLKKSHVNSYQPVFFRLIDGKEEEKKADLLAHKHRFDQTKQDDFKLIPGSPIAYWAQTSVFDAFEKMASLKSFANPCQGLATTNNDLFLRHWFECDDHSFVLPQDVDDEKRRKGKWFACNKGGSFRKWFGNNGIVVNYAMNGKEICDFIDNTPGVKVKSNGRVINRDKYFRSGTTWSTLSSAGFSMRFTPSGYIFETKGAMCFPETEESIIKLTGLGSSKVFDYLLKFISPTLDYHEGPLGKLPLPKLTIIKNLEISQKAIRIAKYDWDSNETSWDFKKCSFIDGSRKVEYSYLGVIKKGNSLTEELLALEEENNTTVIKAYNLENELDFKVRKSEISLLMNPSFVYSHLDEDIQIGVNKSILHTDLLSYSIGCMMGRYSLDREGLVYAHSGNEGFKELAADGAYQTFPADDDGIIPLASQDWLFDDDATTRFREFVITVWGGENVNENLDFVAESLCLHALKPLKSKNGQSESAMDTIRRYFSTQFFKDHCKTYKKRPIYWLFSSGKEKAFECLVYLHRYNEGTLSRMRTEYVTPLMGKYEHHHSSLEQDILEGSTEQKRLAEKALKDLEKKQAELRSFDEQLKHHAEKRITLDLDDGVKVNYGKFGNLLADVKNIHGVAVK